MTVGNCPYIGQLAYLMIQLEVACEYTIVLVAVSSYLTAHLEHARVTGKE